MVSELRFPSNTRQGLLGRVRKRVRPFVSIDGPSLIGQARRCLRNRSRWPRHALSAMLGRRPARLNVQLQTTGVCNASCAMCPYEESWQKRHPGQMSDELFAGIVEQLESTKIDKLCMYLQNEPLLDGRYLDRLNQVCRRLDFELLEISTNASTLTEEMSRNLVEILDGVPNEIWISFHGVDKEGYTKVMNLDFDKTLANIVRLLKLAEQRRIRITIRSAGVAMSNGEDLLLPRFNQRRMEVFWEEVFQKHQITQKPALVYFAYHGRAGSLPCRSRQDHPRKRSLLGFYCERSDQWLHVLYNGEVILCCNDYHRRTVLGNLNTQTVEELLVCRKYREYRMMMMGLKKAPGDFICRFCTKPCG